MMMVAALLTEAVVVVLVAAVAIVVVVVRCPLWFQALLAPVETFPRHTITIIRHHGSGKQ